LPPTLLRIFASVSVILPNSRTSSDYSDVVGHIPGIVKVVRIDNFLGIVAETECVPAALPSSTRSPPAAGRPDRALRDRRRVMERGCALTRRCRGIDDRGDWLGNRR